MHFFNKIYFNLNSLLLKDLPQGLLRIFVFSLCGFRFQVEISTNARLSVVNRPNKIVKIFFPKRAFFT